MWGPYDSVAEAISLCDGGLVASAQVDCSYDPTNDETIKIDNSISGKIYVLLITNYADTVQTINFSKTGGPGTTNCDIVDNFTTSPSDAPSEKPSASQSESPIIVDETLTSPSEAPSEKPSAGKGKGSTKSKTKSKKSKRIKSKGKGSTKRK